MRKSGLGKDWDTFKEKALTGRLWEKDGSTDIDLDFTDYYAKLSDPQKYIFDSREKMNLMYMGQGGGKTYFAGGKSAFFVSNFPNVRGLICANTYKQLTQSTVQNIRNVWQTEFGLQEYNRKTGEGDYVVGIKPPDSFESENHNLDSYQSVISFRNGAIIFIRSLDNYKAIEGMEVGWAFMDETKDTKKEAVQEVVLSRVRQNGMYLHGKNITDTVTNRPFTPIYIITSPAKVSWINEMFSLDKHELDIKGKIYDKTTFFKNKDVYESTRVVIASAYYNEKNLPKNYLQDRERILPKHLVNLLIYSDPFSPEGGEFYKGFDRNKHVSQKPLPYDDTKKINFTFDFNVNPYVTCLDIQVHKVEDKTYVFILNNWCLGNPNNSTPALCEKIRNKYHRHTEGIEVYGDPAGRAQSTRVDKQKEPDRANDFKIIMKKLSSLRPRLKVMRKAPGQISRADFINAIFENNIFGIHIIIDKSCKETIMDFEGLKESKEGKKHKQMVKDNVTGVSYEKYGHTSDAFDYFICQYFSSEYKKFKSGRVR